MNVQVVQERAERVVLNGSQTNGHPLRPSIAHEHPKRRVAPAGIRPGGYPRLVVDVLQYLPQRLDPPAVAADHPGTVPNRVGNSASQHGCVIKVPIPVAGVLHVCRPFEH